MGCHRSSVGLVHFCYWSLGSISWFLFRQNHGSGINRHQLYDSHQVLLWTVMEENLLSIVSREQKVYPYSLLSPSLKSLRAILISTWFPQIEAHFPNLIKSGSSWLSRRSMPRGGQVRTEIHGKSAANQQSTRLLEAYHSSGRKLSSGLEPEEEMIGLVACILISSTTRLLKKQV